MLILKPPSSGSKTGLCDGQEFKGGSQIRQSAKPCSLRDRRDTNLPIVADYVLRPSARYDENDWSSASLALAGRNLAIGGPSLVRETFPGTGAPEFPCHPLERPLEVALRLVKRFLKV